MHWTPWLLLAPFFLACFAGGVWLGRRSRRTALLAISACLLALLPRVVFRYFPGIEFSVLPVGPYSYVRWWWGYVPAFVALGIGVFQMTATSRRVFVEVFAGLLFVMIAGWLLEEAHKDTSELKGHPDKSGVCVQTSDYSCGAAAAATLLAQLGIPSDEREMTELCGTSPGWGTDEFMVARGLDAKLGGRRAVIERADWDALVALAPPAMVAMKLTLLVDHWVVVVHAGEDGVRVGDPLCGMMTLTKARFLDRWQHVLVRVAP